MTTEDDRWTDLDRRLRMELVDDIFRPHPLMVAVHARRPRRFPRLRRWVRIALLGWG